MFSKVIFFCFGTVLILQSCNAEPYKDMDSAVRALKERLKLTGMMFSGINDISKKILQDSVVVIEKMLKDPKILEIKSSSMQTKLDEFRTIVKNYEDLEKSGKYSKDLVNNKIMPNYHHVIGKYEDKENPLEDPEDKIIAHYLKENGFRRFELDSIKALARTLLDKMVAEAEKYLNELNEEEKKEESKLVDLMEAMRNQPDVEKCGKLMLRFLEDFELENFLW